MKLWLGTKEKKTEDSGRKEWREIYQQRKTAADAMDVRNEGKRRKKEDSRIKSKKAGTTTDSEAAQRPAHYHATSSITAQLTPRTPENNDSCDRCL